MATQARYREMVEELDAYVRYNEVTDWELDFIANMMMQRTYFGKQPEHILRLWEKYCLD